MVEQLEDLNKTLEENGHKQLKDYKSFQDTLGELLITKDLSSDFLPLLKDEELRINIQNKYTTLSSDQHVIKFHAITIREGQEGHGVKKMIECIQTVNDQVKIIGNLSPCSELKLYPFTETLRKVIYIFIAIPAKDSERYDELFMGKLFSAVEEGNCGKQLD